jgi:hypothetical protein
MKDRPLTADELRQMFAVQDEIATQRKWRNVPYGPGRVTSDGVDVLVGGAWVAVEPSTVPLGEALAALCDAALSGIVTVCPVCGRYSCECGATDDWREAMTADPDPHGDLSVWLETEIPF